jgi:hypothetical protein
MKNLGKTVFLKTVLLKTMVVVTLLLAASLLVTCDLLFPPDEGDVEWTDVEYETVGAKGNERVKTVKLYLKPDNLDQGVLPGPGTYGVKKSAEQRRIERALSLEGARMSHDYFEAVFMPATDRVARAVWEIGQPAGIAGLDRTVGSKYNLVEPGLGASIIFVGRKTGKTLLGVGYLTHINNKDLTALANASLVVDGNTDSVTFTVSALATWLGLIYETDAPTPVAINPPLAPNTTRRDLLASFNTTYATFVTAYGATIASSVYTPAEEGNTKGEMISPRGTGAIFPLYYLPSVKPTSLDNSQPRVNAAYQIGGLLGTDTGTTAPAGFPPGTNGLRTAVRIWGTRAGEDPYPAAPASAPATGSATFRGGLQWIKRTPAFMVAGINYEINDTVHDKVTKIEDDYTDTDNAALFPANDTAFPAKLPVQFIQSARANGKTSYGIFAVTFQVPVYALYIGRAYNSGTLAPEKWWVRPDYSQYQYLLDNGTDSGGAILLGTDVAGGGGDWIQINTKGIGFDNE